MAHGTVEFFNPTCPITVGSDWDFQTSGPKQTAENYVNELKDVDTFVGDLLDELEARGEPTIVVMYGDHLPGLNMTEEDVTAKGTVELTEAQWGEFFAYLADGTVVKRGNSAESGSRGPWLYLYWTGDGDKYQEFSFDAGSTASAFEAFCEALAQ